MSDWKACMRSNMNKLYELLDTNNGLEGCLREQKVLQHTIIRRIWGIKDSVIRIQELLGQIMRGDDARFNGFCDALRRCGQEHIVDNYLLRPAVCDANDAIPTVDQFEVSLTKEIKAILCSNWNKVIELLVSDSVFLSTLEADFVFTWMQIRKLKETEVDEDRNTMILNNLEKTSLAKYNKFCTSLLKTGQDHVFGILKPQTQCLSPSIALEETPMKHPVMETGSVQVLDQVHELEKNLDRTVLHQQCTDVEIERGIRTQVQCSECIPSGQQTQDSVVNSPAETFNPADEKITFKDDYSIDFVRRFPTAEKLREVEDLVRSNLAYPCRCDGTRQGRALVIANEQFVVNHLPNRSGTEVDVLNLKNLLNYLNCDVTVYQNLAAQGIIKACKEERDKLQSAHTVFICFILSHGDNGIVHGTDGIPVDLEELTGYFDGNGCPILIHKPKIFMIQACQGDLTTEGVPTSTIDQADSDVSHHDNVLRKHEKADIAIILATYPGYLAWRNEKRGSYFIQCVVDVFFKHAHNYHFADLIPMVTQRMNQCVISNKFKQTGLFKTTLEKKIYLLPRE